MHTTSLRLFASLSNLNKITDFLFVWRRNNFKQPLLVCEVVTPISRKVGIP